MSEILETIPVLTSAGTYTINIHQDDFPRDPFGDVVCTDDGAFCMAVPGDRNTIDLVTDDALATRAADALRVGVSRRAVARWLRLSGAAGLVIVSRGYYGDMSADPVSASAGEVDAGMGSFVEGEGFAWTGPDYVAEVIDPARGNATNYDDGKPYDPTEADLAGATLTDVAELSAWATGDVVGWTVTDPDGADLDMSVWGYYGDGGRERAIADARSEVRGDAAERTRDAVRAWVAARERAEYRAELVDQAAAVLAEYHGDPDADDIVLYDAVTVLAELAGLDYVQNPETGEYITLTDRHPLA